MIASSSRIEAESNIFYTRLAGLSFANLTPKVEYFYRFDSAINT